MKLGVSSYSFKQLMEDGAMTQEECVFAAADLGFESIEFADILPHDESSRAEYAERLREACARAGINVGGYAVGADFLTGSGGDLKAEIERVRKDVDIAALLGTPVMRHDAAWGIDADPYKSFTAALRRLADGCREVTEYAAGKGIITTVENHGFYCQDSDRVEALVSAVEHSNFAALIDVGNFLCVDEDPAQAVGVLARHAGHVHVKDFHVKPSTELPPGEGWFTSRGGAHLRGAILGHGAVPLLACLCILRGAGYDGTIMIEFEGLEDPLLALRLGLSNLRRMLALID